MRQKVLLNVGREDQVPHGRVDGFVRALRAHAEKALVLDSMQYLSLTAARAFVGVYVQAAVRRAGLGRHTLVGWAVYSTDVAAAIRSMVLSRCLDPRRNLARWIGPNIRRGVRKLKP